MALDWYFLKCSVPDHGSTLEPPLWGMVRMASSSSVHPAPADEWLWELSAQRACRSFRRRPAASWEGDRMHFPLWPAACGLRDVPSLWWPHESGVGHAKWHGGRGSALTWRSTGLTSMGLFPAPNEILLLQNCFSDPTLLSKLPKGHTSICE